MSRKSLPCGITTIGIDIGKNTFHLIGLDRRGAIALQLKVSRPQLERRLANVPPCLIGMGSVFRSAPYRPAARSPWS
jgi:transposase